MKNQQKIVDNKIFQLSQQQHTLRIVVTRLMTTPGVVMLSLHRIALWCKQDEKSSILVQALTKLSRISLFIVDNCSRRYDSCSAFRRHAALRS
jgi:hypothetical protein